MKLLCFCAAWLTALAVSAGEIHDAARDGNLDRARAILSATPASVNLREKGTTPLHEAVRAGHLAVVQLLVVKGARLNDADIHGLTPLGLAKGYRKTAVADFLRRQGALEKVPVTPKPAALVATPGPAPVVATTAPAPSRAPATILAPAPPTLAPPAANKPPAAPVSPRDMLPVIYPIHEAARIGEVEQIKFLFKSFPDLVESTDEKGLTPLHVAAANKQFAVVEALLGLRAKVNVRTLAGQSPLHFAARAGDVRIAALLLTNRAEVNGRDGYDSTPLLLATQSSDSEEFQPVEAGAGAPAASRDPAQKRAAVLAMHQRQFALTQLLLAFRADVNARSRSGASALMQAVRLRNDTVVELLLRSGAAPGVQESAMRATPLHIAAGRGMTNIARLLLEAKASINATDARGETPLAYALHEGRLPMIALLKHRGGIVGALPPRTPAEQSLVEFYQRAEAALAGGSASERSRTILAMTPTKNDLEKMFPKHAAAATLVVEQMVREIKKAFNQPLQDADAGRELWRITTEPPGLLTQDWISRGYIARGLPVFSLVVDKVGASSRPGDYCLVNNRWVLIPPLQPIAAAHETKR